MKFIFPQNYNFNSKIFGVLEYSAAIIDLTWGGIVYLIINFLIKSISTKIFLFIILFTPILIFSVVGVQGESLIHYITYMTKNNKKKKVYLYDKE